MCCMDVSGPIKAEFRSADFGDARLTDRLTQIGKALGRCPAESIPDGRWTPEIQVIIFDLVASSVLSVVHGPESIINLTVYCKQLP